MYVSALCEPGWLVLRSLLKSPNFDGTPFREQGSITLKGPGGLACVSLTELSLPCTSHMNCMFHSRTLLLVLLWSIFFAVGVNGGVLKARGSSPYLPVMKKAVARSLPVLSSAEVSSFRPFSFYASTAYCQPSQILSWQCGGRFLSIACENHS